MMGRALLGQVGDSEIRLLRVFKTVVECGGLSAAELDLNIGRSTVSRHLKDLEERLGLVLCWRGRAGFSLTTEGQQVYESAKRLLEALDSFRSGVHSLHADLTGSLMVGIFDQTATNPQAQIGLAVRNFKRAAPEVLIDLRVDTLNGIESAVIDGRLQVGVVPDHRRSDSLDYHELFSEKMYLYCGRQHPLFSVVQSALISADVQDYDYAGLAFHSPNMEATHRFQLKRKASVADQEVIATLILSGCYIGFLPDHYAASFVRSGLMQRIEHPNFMYDVQFVAIVRRSPGPSRAAHLFLDALCRNHIAS